MTLWQPKEEKRQIPCCLQRVSVEKGSRHNTAATKIVQSCLDPTLFLFSLVIVSPVIFSRGQAPKGQQETAAQKMWGAGLATCCTGSCGSKPCASPQASSLLLGVKWDQKKATANRGPLLEGTTPQDTDAITASAWPHSLAQPWLVLGCCTSQEQPRGFM